MSFRFHAWAAPSTAFFVVLLAIWIGSGCSRERYASQADRDAQRLVSEKSCDPRWALDDFRINPDPRSRYFDVYSQIRPPMPTDDPASHQYLHEVDHKRGYPHWHVDGERRFLDNPEWRDALYSYCDVNEQGRVRLSLPAAVALASVNSPQVQRQIETVYLSALDVSAQRFEFDVQFFGGNDTTWTHLGRLRNLPRREERNTLETNTDALLRRRFATAGELLVGFANTFVWQFAGPDSNATFSLLNFTLVQPVLRGAFRDIALEDLTQTERDLLGNLRAFERYRQGFFTNLAVGDLGVVGPQRSVAGVSGFPDDADARIRLETLVSQPDQRNLVAPNRTLTAGFQTAVGARLGGFLGLLQQGQEIRNSAQNLDAQSRALRLLEAHLAAGNIELIQVDEFRQNVEAERALLLEQRTRFQNSVDNYKVTTLGLPANLEVEVDDVMLRPIDFNSPAVLELQQNCLRLMDRARALLRHDDEQVQSDIRRELQALTDDARREIDTLLLELDAQEETMGSETADVELAEGPISDPLDDRRDLRHDLGGIEDNLNRIQQQMDDRASDPMPPSQLALAARDLTDVADAIFLAETRLRLHHMTLPTVEMSAADAVQIARLNRLDLMNTRASLVDQWRQIRLQANALESDLDVFVSGDIRTLGNNPIRFRGPTGTMRLGFRFDGAFTRLLERNSFRESIIEYQRARRDLLRFEDSIERNLRRLLREMEQLERNLEIQRKAVAIAVRRVDVMRRLMNRPPVPAPAGGPTNQLSPTTSFNMLTALADLRSSKDNVLGVWLGYHAARILLARELGTMQLDAEGAWLDPDYGLGGASEVGLRPPEPIHPPEIIWEPDSEPLPAPLPPLDP